MSGRFDWLIARVRFWKDLLIRPWVGAVVLIWTFFSNATTIRDNFLTEPWQRRLSMPELLQFLSQWGWQEWLIGMLCITVGVVLEGAYRKWQEEHEQVLALTKQLTELTELKIRCEVHGIPQGLTVGTRFLLFIPEVTITNSSYTRTASIGVELEVPIGGGGIASLASESTPVQEWEQSPRRAGNHCLSFPLNLPAENAASGYIAFGVTSLKGLGHTPDFKHCEIQFTNLHTGEVIHSQAVRFIINP